MSNVMPDSFELSADLNGVNEDAAIAIGSSIYYPSTYGYPYPKSAENPRRAFRSPRRSLEACSRLISSPMAPSCPSA